MKIAERYATATTADDLADHGPRCDLHILTAAGMTGVADSWASSLWRLKYANDPAEYLPVLRRLKKIARQQAGKAVWKLADPGRFARQVLDYWLADICPACVGRGANPILGTPVLEDAPCSRCHGTGRRKAPFGGNLAEYAADLIYILDSAERLAAGRMMEKLADELDLS